MGRYYILDGHKAVEADLLEWAEWFEKTRHQRIVGQTLTPFHWISTVFMGIDHQLGGGPPLLFETMVFTRERRISDFKGRLHSHREEEDCIRYTTWEQAAAGHDAFVRKYSTEGATNGIE